MSAEGEGLDFKKTPAVLLVDDEKSVLSSLRRLFRKVDCTVELANSGKEGLEKLEAAHFDLIVSDARMPEMSGPEFLAIAAEKYPETERILLTGYADMEATIDAINKGKIRHYIEKPWDDKKLIDHVKDSLSIVEMREHNAYLQKLVSKQNDQLKTVNESLEEKVKLRTQNLRKSYEQTIALFSSLLDQRKEFIADSQMDVNQLIVLLAEKLDLTDEEMTSLSYAASLRYIGQLGMPDSLLSIPYTSMDNEQKAIFEEYPERGSLLLAGMLPFKSAAQIIAQHKEYLNGKGYPKQAFGDQISKLSQVISIAGDFIELISGRFQEEKLTEAEAVNFIAGRSGDYYNAELVDVLTDIMGASVDEEDSVEIRIWSKELVPGMELTRSLHSDNGTFLLAKQSVLNEELINKLRNLEAKTESKLSFYVKPAPSVDES